MRTNTQISLSTCIVFIIVGIIMLAASVLFFTTTKAKIEKSVEVTATVTNIETKHEIRKGKSRTKHVAYVDFEYDGHEYENYRLNFYSASMHEGKDITLNIYENPNGNTEVISSSNTNTLCGVFALFGIVFVIAGGVTTKNYLSNKNNGGY
ncbi:MAG: hypothetical protein MJ093_03340 [Saccharofermentans sp.]|nr:hypothetical protein [Saccharofermentans sp.]